MSNKPKYLIVFGTRPEAIKMAPLVNYLRVNDIADYKVCVTAQHRTLLDQVLDFFQIIPDYDLDLMSPNQSLNTLSSRIFQEIDVIYEDYSPDIVFVHGDTTTSSICALAAFHRHIKIAHVEAGLRTFNKLSPFPEEINRQLTGKVADFHLAPTDSAKDNLIKEGVDPAHICVTGNTVIDALIMAVSRLSHYNDKETELFPIAGELNSQKRMILVTGHRRENFGSGFEQICEAIEELALTEEVEIVYPVHLNPNVQEPVYQKLGKYKNIFLIEPVDYPTFVWLMQRSYIILTDSGGVQEEAPALGKPVVVMRDTTERPEVVIAGAAVLAGASKNAIVHYCKQILHDQEVYTRMSKRCMPYGDGNASKMTFEFLQRTTITPPPHNSQ